jgi:hypothetical protein
MFVDMNIPVGQADVRAFSLGPSPSAAEGEGTAEEAAGPAPAGLPETQAAGEAPAPAAGPEEAPLVEGAAAGAAPEVREFESGLDHLSHILLLSCF